MIYYLQFLDSWIKSYEFLKIWIKSDSNFYLKLCLNRKPTRGVILLDDTISDGSDLDAIGSYVERMLHVAPYYFV
jgi:hypothetical protein